MIRKNFIMIFLGMLMAIAYVQVANAHHHTHSSQLGNAHRAVYLEEKSDTVSSIAISPQEDLSVKGYVHTHNSKLVKFTELRKSKNARALMAKGKYQDEFNPIYCGSCLCDLTGLGPIFLSHWLVCGIGWDCGYHPGAACVGL